VLCRRPKEFSDRVTAKTSNCIWKYKGDLVGKINKVSDKAADVIPGSSLIIICSPSHVSLDILKQIEAFVEPNAKIGCIYGGGCFDL